MKTNFEYQFYHNYLFEYLFLNYRMENYILTLNNKVLKIKILYF